MVWEQDSTAVIMLNKIIEKNAVSICTVWIENVSTVFSACMFANMLTDFHGRLGSENS